MKIEAAKFLTELKTTTRYDGVEILDAMLVYASVIFGGLITVPAGFPTDGASVPRLPFIYWFFGNTAKHAAVLHDFLYSSGLVPRAVADAIFREAMESMGLGWIHRNSMWAGVRVFGGSHYKPQLEVPADESQTGESS